ncbi:RDD family protein [Sulfurimonas sp.]|uniref:RDD family protein n=1 Tax=Sulfurimonas sp. TaxID=2022749 RepID=UPI003D0DF5E7
MNEEIESKLHREDIVLASITKRAIALLIDTMLLSFLLNIALYEQMSANKDLEAQILFMQKYFFEIMMMKIVYDTYFIMQYGATIGKLVMKIRVIEIKTLDNPTIFSALNRAIFKVISEIFLYLGFLWGVLDPFRQTWHDKTAKTLVVDV